MWVRDQWASRVKAKFKGQKWENWNRVRDWCWCRQRWGGSGVAAVDGAGESTVWLRGLPGFSGDIRMPWVFGFPCLGDWIPVRCRTGPAGASALRDLEHVWHSAVTCWLSPWQFLDLGQGILTTQIFKLKTASWWQITVDLVSLTTCGALHEELELRHFNKEF